LPSKRVYEILSDASPKVLLSQLKYIKKINLDGHIVGENTDIQIVDTDGENYKGCSVVKNIDCLQKPNKLSSSDLAYIIYTSGSSGKPKGVMIQHYALMNTLLDINQRYEVNTSDTVLALSNYSFDLSVYDIFGLLIAGGKIVLIEEEKAIEPQHWLDLIEKNDISIWNSVPALAQMLVSHASVTNKNIEKLRLFLLSGDWIPLQLPDEIRALHQNSHHLKITSLGGATECAIWSILFDIDQKIAQHWKSIPYGYAMKNQSVYILDEHYNICPKWVVGHIYIGGNGLAQGYLNDQEKTNKHFIINPNNNERMYFTGDLGRYIENGLIEFLGRDDCQVKISGYRIELGDVENTLNNHPLIDRTVVDIHQQGKDKSLIAYISGYNHPKNELTNESMFKSEEEIFNFKINTSNIENFKNGLQEYQLAIDGSINFAKHYCKIRPYRRFDIRNFSQFGVNNLLNNLVRKDVNNSLLSVLNHLSSCYSKDKEKFIYLYPSASSLYSIQVYIKIVNSTMSLDLGYYYFNPESKKLQLIKKIENFDLSETTNSIYFVQKKTLIEPIYGKLSYRFGMLEIGHMLACSGLNILKNYDFLEVYSESDLRGRPQLEKLNLSCDDHKLLVDYQLPDHVAASSDIIKSDFNKSSVVIYYKSDNEKNISEGWYRYHSNNSLNRINIEYKLDVSDFIADNQLIFQDSHFVIFLLADFDNYKSSYVNIGYFAHNLQMNAINNNIGLCPVGTVSNKINRFFENSLGQKIIYTLVGGGLCIDKYDIDYCSIPRDDYRLNAVALRNYLIDLLPDYMVPRNYVFIDEVPLTANGKVDRNKLKKLADKSVTNRSNNQKKPSNSLEKLIHKHWEFILDQEVNSIHESFRYYGGNSLGLLRLANVLSSETNVNITITDLMKNDSIIAQASYIGRMNTESYLQLQEEVIVI